MTPPEKQSSLPITLVNVPREEADKASKQYNQIMDVITNALVGSPYDFRLVATKDKIDQAREDLRKKGTQESFGKFKKELQDASDLLCLTDEPETKPVGSITQPAEEEEEGEKSDLLFPQDRRPQEREAGFAKPYESGEAQDFADQFSQEQVLDILKAFNDQMENLPEQTKARLVQVQVLYIILSTIRTDLANKKGWTFLSGKSTRELAVKQMDKAISALEQLPTKVMQNPNSSINDLIGDEVRRVFKYLPGTFSDKYGDGKDAFSLIAPNGEIPDVTSRLDNEKQFLALITSLRNNGNADSAQRLIEDTLLVEYFQPKVDELRKKGTDPSVDRNDSQRKLYLELERSAEDQAAKVRDKYWDDWRNPSDEMISKGADPKGMSPKQIYDYTQLIRENILDQKLKEYVGKTIYSDKVFDRSYNAIATTAVGNGGEVKRMAGLPDRFHNEVLKQYENMLDTHDRLDVVADKTVDMIIDEIAINAPLIIVSGGIASVARAGVSWGARALLFSTRFARIMEKIGLTVAVAADGVETIVASGRLARGILMTGRLASAGVEAAVFEATYATTQGENFFDQPMSAIVKKVFFTAATFGAFRYTRKAATDLETFLQKNITKIPDKSAQYYIQKLLIHGVTQTSVMLAVGAIQFGIENGNFRDYKFADELFHALVAVGALNIVGAGFQRAIEIGKKKFTPRGREEARKLRAEKEGPFDVSKMSGVKVHPETGAITVRGIINVLKLRSRLMREGYKLEKTKDGFEATDAKGKVLEIGTSANSRAFEVELGKSLSELTSEATSASPRRGVLEASWAKVLAIVMPFLFQLQASTANAWESKTWNQAKKLPGNLDEAGGKVVELANKVTQVPVLLYWVLNLVVVVGLGGVTYKSWPTLVKTFKAVVRTNSRAYGKVERAASALQGRPGGMGADLATNELGNTLRSGGRMPTTLRPDGTPATFADIRASILTDIRNGNFRNDRRLMPLAKEFEAQTTGLLDYMTEVTSGTRPFEQSVFNDHYRAVADAIQGINQLQRETSRQGRLYNANDLLNFSLIAASIAVAVWWWSSSGASSGSAPTLTPPTFNTPGGGAVTLPTFGTQAPSTPGNPAPTPPSDPNALPTLPGGQSPSSKGSPAPAPTLTPVVPATPSDSEPRVLGD